MNRARQHRSGFAAILVVLAVACTSAPAQPSQAGVSPEPGLPVHVLPGGCSDTVVTDSEPPAWSQSGFHAKGIPWPVPWALGTPGDAIAFIFSTQLVAGRSPRVDGSNNKVHWVVKDNPVNLVVVGHPVGRSEPVVGGPSGSGTDEVPTAGCWTFRVLWGSNNQHHSTINLDVLPQGTLPSKALIAP